MRVLVTGSRTWVKVRVIEDTLDGFLREHPGMVLVHGACTRGADAIADRWASVSLESRPALELIEDYGRHKDVALYVDPPYLGSTRSDGAYLHEMSSEAEHRELAEALHQCKASVLLSGYPSDLYDRDLYPGWHRVEFAAGTGQGGAWANRTEVIWSNRAPQGGLW